MVVDGPLHVPRMGGDAWMDVIVFYATPVQHSTNVWARCAVLNHHVFFLRAVNSVGCMTTI